MTLYASQAGMGQARYNQPVVDIIIVNYRSADDTLAAILGLTPWRHGQILVVDNSEDSAEFNRLQNGLQHLDNAKLLLPEKNLGFGRGCNLAYRQSKAEFVLLLNPDARIDEQNILLMVDSLRSNPNFAAVSPRMWWDDARRFLLSEIIPPTPLVVTCMALAYRFPSLALWYSRRYKQRQQSTMSGSSISPTRFLAGAIMLLQRPAIEAAGGLFDNEYFMFYEDSDLSLRLRRAGYKLGLVPQANAVHGYRHKPYKAALMQETATIFFAKNHPWFYRLSGKLAWLRNLGVPLDWTQWGELLPEPIETPGQLDDALRNKTGMYMGIVALSPSPMMIPTFFRAAGEFPVTLDDHDWSRLEPGRYMLQCEPMAGSPGHRRISFEKA